MSLVNRAMAGSYKDFNFELVLHALETLVTLAATDVTTPDWLRPAYTAFSDVSRRWEPLLSEFQLTPLIGNVIKTIVEEINKSCEALDAAALERVRAFVEDMARNYRCRLFTLNYDDLLERSGITFYDGFNGRNFDASGFATSWDKTDLLCHLHGYIRFGLSDAPTSAIETFPTAAEALARPSFLTQIAQSGDRILLGTIVSGLRKTDKVLYTPYSYYHIALIQSIISSPKILVIGYGGYDTYVNQWLINAKTIHGEALRLAWITAPTETEELSHLRPGEFAMYFGGTQNLGELHLGDVAYGNNRVRLIADGNAFADATRLVEFFES